MAVSTVFATAGFAAVSGASVAGGFCADLDPRNVKVGYDKRFAAGLLRRRPWPRLSRHRRFGDLRADRGTNVMLLLAGFIPGAFSAVVYGGLIVAMALIIPGGHRAWIYMGRTVHVLDPRIPSILCGADHHLFHL